MSFTTLPSAAGRRTVVHKTSAGIRYVSSTSRRSETQGGAPRITTGQDFLGANGADALQPESTEKCEGEPSSPSREEPPEIAAGGDNVSSAGSVRSSSAAPGDRKRTTATATKDARIRQPPLIARSLDSVRGSLIRQEETIIFALIEREQFRSNTAIYTERTFRVNRSDAADIYGRDASFLEYMLSETEKLHATGACCVGCV